MLVVRQQVKKGFTYFNTRCAVSGGAIERIMFEHLRKEKALREVDIHLLTDEQKKQREQCVQRDFGECLG